MLTCDHRRMRLAKFLAHAGVASRRGAEEIVRAGRVTIAGKTVTDPGARRRRRQRRRRRRPLPRGPGGAHGLRRQQAGGRALDGGRHARPAHGRRPRPVGAARGCTPSAAWTPTAPASSSSRTTATSPSASRTRRSRCRGRTARWCARRRCPSTRCACCARASTSTTAARCPRRSASCKPGVLELTIREGRNHQVKRDVRGRRPSRPHARARPLRRAAPRRPAQGRAPAPEGRRGRGAAQGRPVA